MFLTLGLFTFCGGLIFVCIRPAAPGQSSATMANKKSKKNKNAQQAPAPEPPQNNPQGKQQLLPPEELRAEQQEKAGPAQ
jgi:hypothetical protein